MTDSTPAPDSTPGNAKGKLARSLALYTFARLVLVAILAGVIVGISAAVGAQVPLLVALVFAVLIALPLSLVLFKKLRTDVNVQIAAVDEQRRKDREELRSKLRGDK